MTAPASSPSTDSQYLRKEFQSWQGDTYWSAGWNPPLVREAVGQHLAGNFYASARLAVDCVRYPPIMGAIRQRMAPALRTQWTIKGSDRAPARFAREDMEDAWAQIRTLYGDILKDLALMGFAWLHSHMVVGPDGIERPRIKHWRCAATRWMATSPVSPGGFYASTLDGWIPMNHGDGKWTLIGDGHRPHQMGAIVALGLSYMAGELGRRDRAGLSEGAGRAAPVATMGDDTPTNGPEGQLVAEVVASIGRGKSGAVLPRGTTLAPFSISSDTSFFSEALKDELTMVAFAVLGQSGTLAAGSGGVYSSPVFAGVAESLIDADLEATENGFNSGISAPVTELNYPGVPAPQLTSESTEEKVARAKATGERLAQLHAIMASERSNGCELSQERIDALAAELDVTPPVLATAAPKGAEVFAYDLQGGIVTRNEQRALKGLPPLPDGDETVPEFLARMATIGQPQPPEQPTPSGS